ncbi:FkbM family methyltransferase [Paracoccus xiamenensis]|uniref:FkbM family methyltransferase n=1 Tax=Paracoccus xiamenensis TaxID=2714901 RepID=UPI00140858A2|nr:FkbM family methyltransferase [Paracoccus xiamenensis]NHF73019.1 FkbM family methyltransferase [Paracoccus xiamenensis]
MSGGDDSATAADLEQQLKKLRRRQKRNERAAWANGLLTGICGMLRPGDLAIDCGANAGEISARLLASGADVVAFDPEPWANEQLTRRFGGEDRFTLHPAAVGTSEGVVKLMRANNFDGNAAQASVKSTVVTGGRQIDESTENAIEVPQIDFISFLRDTIARRGEVAFLKIDIEGAELDLVPAIDAAGLFAAIRCTVVETHERKFRDRAADFQAMRKAIAERYAPSHVSLDWI